MHPELHLGSITIPTYFLIISIDFCLMFWYLSVRSQKWNVSSKMALDVGLVATVFGFISARLFHVFYEVPEYYLDHPAAILYLWEGGYVFFAGLLGGLAAGLIWLYWRKQKIFIWLDLFAPILALGYSLGRWACFFQGCCYGQETHCWLGFHFENITQAGEHLARYPTQLMASFGELLIFFILLLLEKKKKMTLQTGQLFAVWMMGHGLNRILMELFRDDPRGPLIFNLGISFWIALGLALTGVFLFRARRKTKPA